jgi:hypothetical protein
MRRYGSFSNLWAVVSFFVLLLSTARGFTSRSASASIADPYNYRNITPVYVAPTPANVTTLLDFINSRSDLSSLASVLVECGGFPEAFDTKPTWDFTFFAPNNDAFAQTGTYLSTNEATP